jgi:hypothetical protein
MWESKNHVWRTLGGELAAPVISSPPPVWFDSLSSSNLGLHPTPSPEPALFLQTRGRLSDPWRLAGMVVKPLVLCYFPMACDVGEHPLWVRILIPSQRSRTHPVLEWSLGPLNHKSQL